VGRVDKLNAMHHAFGRQVRKASPLPQTGGKRKWQWLPQYCGTATANGDEQLAIANGNGNGRGN